MPIELPDEMIAMPKALADALYNTLLRPTSNREGQAVYEIGVNLASEIRTAIAAGKGKKQ